MRRVARRTAESTVNMRRVLTETGILQNVRQVVTFSAQRVWTIDANVGIRKQIVDCLPRHSRLAEFIAPLQDVSPLGSVRPVRSRATEFAIVIAVVAIGAKDLHSRRSPFRRPIQIPHVQQ